ncbi:MAG: cytidylate kinase family protein [Clostridia bacterium]|nr:cytidylate kinase family protein [Clostridia bacterium]
MKEIITIAGTVGSGKSTICNMLSKKLGYTCYVMGDIIRKLANEHNMDIIEFNNLMATNPDIDHKVDDILVKIATEENKLIISSRTGWHFIPSSFKVYLTINDDEAAKRIYGDNDRISERKTDNIEQAKKNVIKRNVMETKRYMDVYGIDVSKKENYDLYLDTSDMSIDEVIEIIIEKYNEWMKGR